MSLNFSPELYEILENGGIIMNPSNTGGGNTHAIAPGLYKFTLPDGREILMDENGNIIG